MHYYQHHIGDFIRDTAQLNDHQLATYLRLIWIYYDSEKPISDDLGSVAFAVRSDEKTVGLILRHYFTRSPDGWTHARCEKEISEYKARGDKARQRANARWSNAAAMPQHSHSNAAAMPQHRKNGVLDANQEPITKNQEPRKEKTKEGHPALVLPDWMPESVWQEWRQHRKAIRKPLTAGAEDLTLRKLAAMHDAGHDPIAVLQTSIANGWTGVFTPAERSPPSAAQRSTSAADRQAEAIYRITGGLAGKPSTDERVIDVESFRQRQLAGR
jgi:uncharacterized protein YdaU (DUF1376 family)